MKSRISFFDKAVLRKDITRFDVHDHTAGAVFTARFDICSLDLLVKRISEVDTLQLINAIPFGDLLGIMVAAFTAAGLFVGVFGSLMSIRKFLDV